VPVMAGAVARFAKITQWIQRTKELASRLH
jgi:hypothetical protein